MNWTRVEITVFRAEMLHNLIGSSWRSTTLHDITSQMMVFHMQEDISERRHKNCNYKNYSFRDIKGTNCIEMVVSKMLWWWCIKHIIIGFLNFVHRPICFLVFGITDNRQSPESPCFWVDWTGSVYGQMARILSRAEQIERRTVKGFLRS
jgi:hypothetical protein